MIVEFDRSFLKSIDKVDHHSSSKRDLQEIPIA